MAYSQLLNDCKVVPLTIDVSGNSGAVDCLDVGSVAFLVRSTAVGAMAFKVQESADSASNFTDLVTGYFEDGVSSVNQEGATVLSVSATTTAIGQCLAISVNRQGRETSVPDVRNLPVSKRYLRIVATTGKADVDYAVALCTNNSMTPVEQPAFAAPEVKGSN
jgi:hypothetical protein